MATGLPDQEAQNEEEQTNELDQLNNTMGDVGSLLREQLESLKSIARWQDQTALYTSHLENIKVDMNQVRKWGEPINRIAQRVDVIAAKLTADAAPNPDEKPKEDASALGPVLGEIAANTRMTFEAVQVLADATRESQEDKREVKEKVQPEKKEKKEEQGVVRKQMSDSMGSIKDFFGKIITFFAMAGALIVPLMVGPDKLFTTLREFFGRVRNMFTQLAEFFLTTVVPAISFLMERLFAFFNTLSPHLERMGSALADALRLVGPKLWNVLSPILDAIGTGIIKAVDFFTVALGKIGPAMDVIGEFLGDVFGKFSKREAMVANVWDSIGGFFDNMMDKLQALSDEDFMDRFRISLQEFWNGTMDVLHTIMETLVSVASRSGILTKDQAIALEQNVVEPLAEMKFDVDRSALKGSMIDFSGSDADVKSQINSLRGTGPNQISDTEASTMLNNIGEFRRKQEIRTDKSVSLLSGLGEAKDVSKIPGSLKDTGQVIEVKGVQAAFPGNFDRDVVYFGTDKDGKFDFKTYYPAELSAAAHGTNSQSAMFSGVAVNPAIAMAVENAVERGQTPEGSKLIGSALTPDEVKTLPQKDMFQLQNLITGESGKLVPVGAQTPGAGTNNMNFQNMTHGGQDIVINSIHSGGPPAKVFEGRR